MKNENHNDPSPVGSTRRSFIKKSVVAAVAASSMTIFSGLVNASTSGECYSTPEGDTTTYQFKKENSWPQCYQVQKNSHGQECLVQDPHDCTQTELDFVCSGSTDGKRHFKSFNEDDYC